MMAVSEAPGAESVSIRGAVSRLWREWQDHDEVLLDGPAGTGKSMGVAIWVDHIARTYPECRILVCRKTRVSLTHSWMTTFRKALAMRYGEHEAEYTYLFRGATDAHRQQYTYKNGAKVVLGGMDNPTRLFSTEYDLIYVNEANELAEGEWESLHRALRNGVLPHHTLIGDCNPDAKTHWLFQRFSRGTTERMLSRHTDNPFLTDTEPGKAYLEKLRTQLTGVRYERLYLGNWCTAEGAIWPEFSLDKHQVVGSLAGSNGNWKLKVESGPEGLPEEVKLSWFFGSQDWGFVNPGCQQIWGVDPEGRMYLVRETYMTGKTHDWWAGHAVAAWREYGTSVIVCDSAEPSGLQVFNDRLANVDQHAASRFAVEADKRSVSLGIDAVRERLLPGEDGLPRLFFLRDSLAHSPDPQLGADYGTERPKCTVEELPSYAYAPVLEGHENKERPHKINDHGCDALRYACLYAWSRDHSPLEDRGRYAANTWGKILKLEERFGA